MTYLPPIKIDGTEFPKPMGADLVTTIGMIEEMWDRSYPLVDYTPLSKQTTPVSDPSQMSGQDGTTKFDPMWGESVDRNMQTWDQPHHSGTFSAADPAVYNPAIKIRCRIERGVREMQLRKYGFDPVRNIVATIPTSMLDKAGITVQAGDRFMWNNELLEVLQWNPLGFYYANNVNLYIVMSVANARRGS